MRRNGKYVSDAVIDTGYGPLSRYTQMVKVRNAKVSKGIQLHAKKAKQ